MANGDNDQVLDNTPDEDDVATEETTTETAEEEFTPPSKEEWAKTQAALKKANDEAKRNRLKVTELSRAHEDDSQKREREATEAAQQKFKPVAVKAAARAEFLAAGLSKPDRVAGLSKLLDMDQVEIDDDGDISGLADQVAAIKVEFPELFEKKPGKPGRLDTAGRKAAAPERATSTGELHAARVLGNGVFGRD